MTFTDYLELSGCVNLMLMLVSAMPYIIVFRYCTCKPSSLVLRYILLQTDQVKWTHSSNKIQHYIIFRIGLKYILQQLHNCTFTNSSAIFAATSIISSASRNAIHPQTGRQTLTINFEDNIKQLGQSISSSFWHFWRRYYKNALARTDKNSEVHIKPDDHRIVHYNM